MQLFQLFSKVSTSWLTFNTTFTRIGQQYYYIPEHKSTWFGALHTCRQIGGDLALIESAEQMRDISSYLIGKGYKSEWSEWFWISGNDLAVTSTFMSVTNGMPLTFLNWSSGQPDWPGVEQCIHLWLVDGTFKMNNRGCKEEAFYICQTWITCT